MDDIGAGAESVAEDLPKTATDGGRDRRGLEAELPHAVTYVCEAKDPADEDDVSGVLGWLAESGAVEGADYATAGDAAGLGLEVRMRDAGRLAALVAAFPPKRRRVRDDGVPAAAAMGVEEIETYRGVAREYPFTYGFVTAGPHAEDLGPAQAWLGSEGGAEGADWIRTDGPGGRTVEFRFRDGKVQAAFVQAVVAPTRPPEPAAKPSKPSARRKAPRKRNDAESGNGDAGAAG